MTTRKTARKTGGSAPKKRYPVKAAAGSAPKTAEEIKQIGSEAMPALAVSGTTVGCWFKDSGGGPDYCIPMPSSDACKNAGGSPTDGTCPNTFTFFARHIADLNKRINELETRVAGAAPDADVKGGR